MCCTCLIHVHVPGRLTLHVLSACASTCRIQDFSSRISWPYGLWAMPLWLHMMILCLRDGKGNFYTKFSSFTRINWNSHLYCDLMHLICSKNHYKTHKHFNVVIECVKRHFGISQRNVCAAIYLWICVQNSSGCFCTGTYKEVRTSWVGVLTHEGWRCMYTLFTKCM